MGILSFLLGDTSEPKWDAENQRYTYGEKKDREIEEQDNEERAYWNRSEMNDNGTPMGWLERLIKIIIKPYISPTHKGVGTLL